MPELVRILIYIRRPKAVHVNCTGQIWLKTTTGKGKNAF